MRNLSMFVLVLGLVACRGGGSGGDDTGGGTDSGTNTGDVTIQQIQDDAMPKCDAADPMTCTPLSIKGVVVIAIDSFGSRTGDLFVEEPDGGPFSGVKVYGAPLDQIAALAPGDLVDISDAVKDEFTLNGATASVTELKPVPGGTMTVKKVGTGSVPAPALVDAAALAMMSADAQKAEWEKWEGVLVKVTNAKQINDVKSFGGGAVDQTSFNIAGGAVVVSALAALPASAVADTCFSGITGVGDFAFDYEVFPRTGDDLVTGGTGCAANTVTTISAIQTAATPPTGTIEIKSVCVVALSRPAGMPATSKNMWVQTSAAQATANNGIYVYGPGTDLGAFTPGKTVDVVGTVKEFNNATGTGTLTEIAASSVKDAGGTCAPTPILDQSAANLSMDVNGEPLESVLIELKNVTITAAADPNNFYVGQMQQGTQSFKFDDDIFRVSTAAGATCYSFTGIWSYQVYDDAWYFLPTQAGTSMTCQ